MNKYKILKLGEKTEFETDQLKIDALLEAGYKIISEIEASSVGDARYKNAHRSAQTTDLGAESTASKNPSSYLEVTSTLFLLLSLIGCLVLLTLGFDARDSYETRRYAVLYFTSAFACFVITLLIHSVCRSIIYIANK
ncbi:hypothetical protein [Rheinheimera sp. MM224]|uniref:hypothetical protein n=1 Tax=Rheinheimera sp. MM224 TaxID=3019969 RepID=UPI0021F86690|nr:hypothetical protein [Rheinheimera sp. MM224]CAI3804419.1 hypothetical protein JAMGFMIE_03616 [Rheinheimera sp. MM224]